MASEQAGNGQHYQPAKDSHTPLPASTAAAVLEAGVIRGWLVGQIAEMIGAAADEIDVHAALDSFGISSREAVTLSGDLETWLGRSLSPTLIYEYPTIAVLADHLAGVEPVAPPQPTPTEPTDDEAIAVIGIGCRFPGAADPDAFWHLLANGVDAIGVVPADRWNADDLYDQEPGTPGKMSTRWGGFLERVAEFDARFFGISPREATRMDPQQRLLLEVAWSALEDAGQAPDQLAGSNTGVFIGISSNDYAMLQYGDREAVDAYAGTGNAASIAANRLSYLLDLRGPSLSVDTACSSSLVAVHLACQSLRSGESRLALVGGVNLILAPELTITFSHARMMAADGRCKTFDAAADGYVRSEGSGVVVLKRLSDARADGDTVLALIRGSAVNQDGHSNGLTAPNGLAQQAVVRSALQAANIAPHQLGYIETHGTGTVLGDSIEIRALAAVMHDQPADQPVAIGSLKTNIGHLEAAAGIAGLIKVVLALKHELLPPHLHLHTLNPHIALHETPLEIVTAARPWPASDRPRYASVSSFGFGGTNAHVVLEEALRSSVPAAEIERPLHLLALSAKDERALHQLAASFAQRLTDRPSSDPADICFSANTGRAHWPYRLSAIGQTAEQLREQLTAFTAGQESIGLQSGHAAVTAKPKIAWLFTGQGAQYVGMGRDLYETQTVFRAALLRCADILDDYLDQPLLDLLFAPEAASSLLDQTAYTQPALFALEYALAQLWLSWGVTPDYVMGHSVGEYVAACIAGVFSLEDGLALIAERGRLMQTLPPDGLMATVFAPHERVAAALVGRESAAAIAAINGATSTVIAGKAEAVRALVAQFAAEQIEARPLSVSHAFHSPLMEPILDDFERAATTIALSAPTIPLISNLTGELLPEGTRPDAYYWRQHARQPVQFLRGMHTLRDAGCSIFIEIGPQPTLLSMGKRSIDAALWLPSLQQQAPWETLLDSLSTLYINGWPIDWAGFDRGYSRRRIQLPTYPFQRERFWFDEFSSGTGTATRMAARPLNGRQHPLLGRRIDSPLRAIQWEATLDHDALADQNGNADTLYRAMALAAADEIYGTGAHEIATLVVHEPLVLSAGETRAVQLVLDPTQQDRATFNMFSRTADAWTLHSSGTLQQGRAIVEPTGTQPTAATTQPRLTADTLRSVAANERPGLLEHELRRQLARVLRLKPDQIDSQQPIQALGMDSIMAIELKSVIERQLGIQTPIASLLSGPSTAQLAEQLAASLAAPAAPIVAAGTSETSDRSYPLSHGQRALWFQHQIDPDSVFNPIYAARSRSRLDVAALRAAFQRVAERHPALRTTFSAPGGEPMQQVQTQQQVMFQHEDAAGWSEALLQGRLAEEARRPFDLASGPLLRVHVFSIGPDDHLILLAAHHIVVDLWSQALIISDVGQLYRDPNAAPLRSSDVQYSDYVRWQSALLAGPEGARLWSYWQNKLGNGTSGLATLNLPTDCPRPIMPTFRGRAHRFQLTPMLSQQIKVLSEQLGATLYTTLLSAFKVLLYRYSGQTDIIVGTPTTGRSRSELMEIVGYFVNPVALRSDLSGAPSFAALLALVRQTVVDAIAHQDYPIALLVEKLQPNRQLNRTPLFQVMFVFQRAHLLDEQGLSSFALGTTGASMELGGLPLESVELEQHAAPFDLTLMMAEAEHGLGGTLTYNTDLYNSDTIERLVGHFQTLLEAIVAAPDQPITQIPLLTAAERQYLLAADNDQPWSLDRRVHELFEAHAEQTPDALAVVLAETQLSYGELNQRANQLAHCLRRLGVGPDVLVALCVERSIEMIVGLLGVLKAGGAYVPMDPAYPAERLQFMLQDTQAQVLLTQQHIRNTLAISAAQPLAHVAHTICLDTEWDEIAAQPVANLKPDGTLDDLAYVIYTSGSTGQPKGVLLHHRGLSNLVLAQTRAFSLQPQSRVLQFASFSFDASVSEIFMALASGARLVLAPRETLLSHTSLLALLRDAAITTVTLPPSLLALLPPEQLPTLHTVISAGESCPVEVARRWTASAGRHFFNAYGPTEATIGPALYEVAQLPDDATSVPIGRPIPNIAIYLLDQHQQPVPIGMPGEIYVAGAGVARGYLNRPELTAERFIEGLELADAPTSSMRLYRTGDLGRYLPDRTIEYLGRADQQVKLRGFRIEPGEIEAILTQHPAVGSAAVIVREDVPGDKRLVAYVVPHEQSSVRLSTTELRTLLKQRVPEYMVPSLIMTLPALPLTLNGKLDHKALPAPQGGRPELATGYVKPQTDVERTIAAIWQEVLHVEKVGLHDNFFDLGGHSLLLAKVHGRLQESLHTDVPLIELFHFPTVQALAQHLARESSQPSVQQRTQDRASKQKTALSQHKQRPRVPKQK